MHKKLTFTFEMDAYLKEIARGNFIICFTNKQFFNGTLKQVAGTELLLGIIASDGNGMELGKTEYQSHASAHVNKIKLTSTFRMVFIFINMELYAKLAYNHLMRISVIHNIRE
jgi:hypothetical protein